MDSQRRSAHEKAENHSDKAVGCTHMLGGWLVGDHERAGATSADELAPGQERTHGCSRETKASEPAPAQEYTRLDRPAPPTPRNQHRERTTPVSGRGRKGADPRWLTSEERTLAVRSGGRMTRGHRDRNALHGAGHGALELPHSSREGIHGTPNGLRQPRLEEGSADRAGRRTSGGSAENRPDPAVGCTPC